MLNNLLLVSFHHSDFMLSLKDSLSNVQLFSVFA